MAEAPGRTLLTALKAAACLPGPRASLVIGSPPEALLRPVATAGAQHESDARLLTAWRNRFKDAFLHEFEATEERTKAWLSRVVGPSDDRALFMVSLPDGTTIGYMGLAYIDWARRYGEADAIVRGKEAPKGLMQRCLTELISWGQAQLGLQHVAVRVRSDNPAVEFYRRIGFEETKRVPLIVVDESDGRRFEEAAHAHSDLTLVHMTWKLEKP